MAWDSQQYLKFANERNRPCLDLISKLQGDFNTILDLGCGPGNSSKNLFHQYRNIKCYTITDNTCCMSIEHTGW